MRAFLLGSLILILSLGPASAARLGAFPDHIDPAGRYIFYMHGGYVEKRGSDGTYRYWEILEALRDRGLTVIGEARSKVPIGKYAKKVARQVRALLDAGVPARRITVAGHSRGGFIALVTATRLREPHVRFAILSACGLPGTRFEHPYRKFIKKEAANLNGIFMTMWDRDDVVAKDCDRAYRRGGVRNRNLELNDGGGHEIFYTPRDVWLDPLIEFTGGG